MVKIIEKKTTPELFSEVLSGKKTFEVRLADWKCEENDTLILREWDPKKKKYTGRSIKKRAGYILKTKDLRFFDEKEIQKHGFQIISLE